MPLFRRRSRRSQKKDETEDEFEADPTVTEASVSRGRSRRRRTAAQPEDADTGHLKGNNILIDVFYLELKGIIGKIQLKDLARYLKSREA